MAPEVPASSSPHHSPPRSPEPGHGAVAVADPPPLVPPTRDEWPEPEKPPSAPPPPLHTAVVVSSQPRVAAAKYVPPRAASRTADSNPGRSGDGGWYSWNGGRTARPAPRARPASPPRRQWAEEAPPPPPPAPAPAPASAPAPPTRPAAAPPPPPPAVIRSVDRVVPDILSRKRRAAVLQRAALAARGAAAGLCLAALAVLAADTRKGWALDSYSSYSQLRYSEAVNVIGFVYSLFQFFILAELIWKNKHLIPHPKRDLFDFIMDQVLAYLLISSSSSATARVGDWIDNWGSDPFPNMANGSIVVSFLAFIVFAICALISAYNLFRRDL